MTHTAWITTIAKCLSRCHYGVRGLSAAKMVFEGKLGKFPEFKLEKIVWC